MIYRLILDVLIPFAFALNVGWGTYLLYAGNGLGAVNIGCAAFLLILEIQDTRT